MRRRSVVRGLLGLGTVALAGCPADGSPTTDASADTATADTSPSLVSVSSDEIVFPDRLNRVTLTIRYQHLDGQRDYEVRVRLESNAGTVTETKRLEKASGVYPGITSMQVRPAVNTSTEGEFLYYRVDLVENGTVVDSTRGGLPFE